MIARQEQSPDQFYDELASHWFLTRRRMQKLAPFFTNPQVFWSFFTGLSAAATGLTKEQKQYNLMTWVAQGNLPLDVYARLINSADLSNPQTHAAILILLEKNSALREALYKRWQDQSGLADVANKIQLLFGQNNIFAHANAFPKTFKRFAILAFGVNEFDVDSPTFENQINNILGNNGQQLLADGLLAEAAIAEANRSPKSTITNRQRAIANIRNTFFSKKPVPFLVNKLNEYTKVTRELHAAYLNPKNYRVPANIADNFTALVQLTDDPISFTEIHGKYVSAQGLAKAAFYIREEYAAVDSSMFNRFLNISIGFFNTIKKAISGILIEVIADQHIQSKNQNEAATGQVAALNQQLDTLRNQLAQINQRLDAQQQAGVVAPMVNAPLPPSAPEVCLAVAQSNVEPPASSLAPPPPPPPPPPLEQSASAQIKRQPAEVPVSHMDNLLSQLKAIQKKTSTGQVPLQTNATSQPVAPTSVSNAQASSSKNPPPSASQPASPSKPRSSKGKEKVRSQPGEGAPQNPSPSPVMSTQANVIGKLSNNSVAATAPDRSSLLNDIVRGRQLKNVAPPVIKSHLINDKPPDENTEKAVQMFNSFFATRPDLEEQLGSIQASSIDSAFTDDEIAGDQPVSSSDPVSPNIDSSSAAIARTNSIQTKTDSVPPPSAHKLFPAAPAEDKKLTNEKAKSSPERPQNSAAVVRDAMANRRKAFGSDSGLLNEDDWDDDKGPNMPNKPQ